MSDLTQAAELLRTPEPFRQWLSEQDPERRIDPAEPCACFIHHFIKDATGKSVSVTETAISPDSSFHRRILIPQRWFYDLQNRAIAMVENDERDDYSLTCAEALKVLDAVIAEQNAEVTP